MSTSVPKLAFMFSHVANVARHSSHQLTIAPFKRSTLFHRLLAQLTRPLPCPCRATHVRVANPPDRDAGIAGISRVAKPDEALQLSLLFSTHYLDGQFIATLNGGIMARLGPLWEHEGVEVVACGLGSIWEDLASRPEPIFCDTGCALRRTRLNRPDDAWLGTRQTVER